MALSNPPTEQELADVVRYAQFDRAPREDDEPGPEPATTPPAPTQDAETPPPRFSTLADFLTRKLPRADPLLGDPSETFLAAYSLLLLFGDEGAGKSTFSVDGIAHLAAGVEWLGIPVARPVRCVVVENEGPASLWQRKLAAKAEAWDGPAFIDNVHVFESPWGVFSFALPSHREALTAYCDEHLIDLVVANPTLALGVAGTGTPDETQAFVELLKECGLWTRRAFWLLHHKNKAGQMSGDWGRQSDTNIELERDGNRARTKLSWRKTRWVEKEERPRSCLLDWVQETAGYSVLGEIDTVGATDDALRARLDEYLTNHPRSTTHDVEQDVKGTGARLRALLKAGGYRKDPGPRGASLWSLGGPDDVTPEPEELF